MTAAPLRVTAVALCLSTALMELPVAAARADEQPVASATSSDGKVRVDVLSLKRSEGDTVTLRLAVINKGNADFSIVLGNMKLIDLVARRAYSVGLSSSACRPAPDQRLTCWATFAAPPASTKTMNVQLYEHFDLITGVPITE